LKITYFVNHYPKVSHSFIRREVLALERLGFEVQRVALRGWSDSLPDDDDQRERNRTAYVLRRGLASLILPTLRVIITSPGHFLAALKVAIGMARDSERSLPYHLVYLAEACELLRLANLFGSERLHAHFGTNSAEIAMLARIMGGPPYSFTVHGPDEFSRSMGLREKIRRASFVVAISSFTRSQLYLLSALADWPKIHVVHCGLERQFYENANEAATGEQPTGMQRFVCVGRLTEAKGQLLLVQAFARAEAEGRRFELVLAGDGPLRGEIEQLVRDHGMTDRIRITGWISSAQVREEILAARALILPSFAEGLPVVIMEAMALRRPVLSTYVAGIPELVIPGENGWLFPAGCIEAIVAALKECADAAPVRLAELGDAAHERVVQRHAVDFEADRLAALFRSPGPGTERQVD
jgi:glycosyltransferase involved in cell wall biosynthesis